MNYLNETQIATKFGVSRSTIRRWKERQEDPLPYLQCGIRSLRFIEEEAEKWFERFRIKGEFGDASKV